MVPDSINGHHFKLALMSLFHFPINFFFSIVFLSSIIKYSRVILCLQCLGPESVIFLQKQWFLSVGKDIRNKDLGASIAHWTHFKTRIGWDVGCLGLQGVLKQV